MWEACKKVSISTSKFLNIEKIFRTWHFVFGLCGSNFFRIYLYFWKTITSLLMSKLISNASRICYALRQFSPSTSSYLYFSPRRFSIHKRALWEKQKKQKGKEVEPVKFDEKTSKKIVPIFSDATILWVFSVGNAVFKWGYEKLYPLRRLLYLFVLPKRIRKLGKIPVKHGNERI